MEKFRILVIDDKLANLESAENQFADKNVELTIVSTYQGALYLIKNARFDIVLTDLMMPGDGEGISGDNPEIGKEVPYGLILSILAKNKSVENVAILSDISHHAGPIAWAMDNLMRNDSFIRCYGNKNWLGAASEFVSIIKVDPDEKLVFHKPTVLLAGHGDEFKRNIQSSIPSKFEVIFIEEESDYAETFGRFIDNKPEFTLIIGEIFPGLSSGSLSAKKIFKDLQDLKTPEQKVFAAGFMSNSHSDYIRLPLEIDEILEKVGLV